MNALFSPHHHHPTQKQLRWKRNTMSQTSKKLQNWYSMEDLHKGYTLKKKNLTALYRKCWTTSLVIMPMSIKTTMRPHYTPIRKTRFLTDCINTLAKVCSNGTSHTSETERWTGTALRQSGSFLTKLTDVLPHDPLSPTPRYLPKRNENTFVYTKTCMFSYK